MIGGQICFREAYQAILTKNEKKFCRSWKYMYINNQIFDRINSLVLLYR